MNWSVWGPVFGSLIVAVIGLLGVVFQVYKNHQAAREEIGTLRQQADAATIQANAALEAARASTRTAEATAQAAINDTFTKAYEAASANWARYTDAIEKRLAEQGEEIVENAKRIDKAEMLAEADRQARDVAEKKFRIAEAWMRRCIRWIKENLPGADYPPVPPELDIEL
ncbi:hypothetical protein [Mycobacterium avium]|uniref:hypothetical protein n=1 Tax=Mycobacterium avium TaxID=1764 RepID=UPI001CCA428B|nr:hypothetical protein [Mycobacterium avium]MBZ4576089.1 hypothetical protein [Mycobacterium avium subsp. hominissuis]